MTRFYRGMIQQALTPSAALRAAQVEMLKSPRWRHPFSWAAFVVQGDWD
jgi:CHAT domain-containing protein